MPGDRFSEDVKLFKKVLPDISMLDWETYSEIYMESGQLSNFLITTSVVLFLPKGDMK